MTRSTGFSFTCALCAAMAVNASATLAAAPNSQPNPYAQQFAASLKRSQDSTAGAGNQLGASLDDALQAKQVARLSVTLKCNHYDVIEVIYRDGSIKVVDDPRAPTGRNEPVDRDQLNMLAASLPGFVWGEIECDS